MVYVGRSGDHRFGLTPSKWGNPFRVGRGVTPESAVDSFRRHLRGSDLEAHSSEFAGRDLVCHCGGQDPCHADGLLELANAEPHP